MVPPEIRVRWALRVGSAATRAGAKVAPGEDHRSSLPALSGAGVSAPSGADGVSTASHGPSRLDNRR